MQDRVLARAVLFACLFVTARARADFPSIDTRAFAPPTDPAGSLYLEPAPTPGPGAFSGATWFAYRFRPAVLRGASGAIVSHLVDAQVLADLVANLGVSQRFALGLDVPFVVFQQGNGDATAIAVPGASLPSQALGDLA